MSAWTRVEEVIAPTSSRRFKAITYTLPDDLARNWGRLFSIPPELEKYIRKQSLIEAVREWEKEEGR